LYRGWGDARQRVSGGQFCLSCSDLNVFILPVEIMGRMPHDLHHNAPEGKSQSLLDSYEAGGNSCVNI
jgi:hypothetical protein